MVVVVVRQSPFTAQGEVPPVTIQFSPNGTMAEQSVSVAPGVIANNIGDGLSQS